MKRRLNVLFLILVSWWLPINLSAAAAASAVSMQEIAIHGRDFGPEKLKKLQANLFYARALSADADLRINSSGIFIVINAKSLWEIIPPFASDKVSALAEVKEIALSSDGIITTAKVSGDSAITIRISAHGEKEPLERTYPSLQKGATYDLGKATYMFMTGKDLTSVMKILHEEFTMPYCVLHIPNATAEASVSVGSAAGGAGASAHSAHMDEDSTPS